MYRQKNYALRKVLRTMLIAMILIVLGFYLYVTYNQIEVEDYEDNKSYSAIRTSQTIEEAQEQSKSVADIIEEVTNCVVGISKLQEKGNSIFLKDGSAKLGLGTGVILSEDGYILTNQHVAGAKYSNCYVTLENGTEYKANVVWADEDIDLAIIKINVKGLPSAKLGDSDQVRTAEAVYAIGNPIGFEFQKTVTAGIISGVDRTIKLEEEDKVSYMEDLLQTDATINPGNSGGPLINLRGEVIGINTVKITSAEGIGFAIPINIVKPIIESYKATQDFEEAYIGMFSYDTKVIPYLNNKDKFENGIYVVEVVANGPAQKAGIKNNDVILRIDGKELNKMSELRKYIYTKKPADEVTLLVQRNGIQVPVKVTLGKK